ncbi:Uncharacterized membrane protein [Marinactinospora thermotolerans DSM 45154]|uniref:Uncharacterized membrane protein n=2 Tax=Marinactinospora thermotolerans TaxID=531310 RepID=A0A1T4PLR9_9ACTN|nr:Uncharacterized membrane protein [Marinactinospora thermotolerans DSM 45154]
MTASLLIATLTTGLLAGLFQSFVMSVMPGLARSSDRTFVEAMRRINEAIINPWLFLVLFGSPVSSLVAAVLLFRDGSPAAVWTLAALLLSVATFLITAAANVPLNNALAASESMGGDDAPARARRSFERAWVRWNVARTMTSVAAFACLAWALILHGAASTGA